jgi:pimeloyl-ACP methyl ester carboxylesterase
MLTWRSVRPFMILFAAVVAAYLALGVVVAVNQRSFIYFPTHDDVETPLRPWVVDGQIIGYCHSVREPRTVWLMAHGNAGQASHRSYVLARMSPTDSLYVLEYPGFGLRDGHPSKDSMNAAAAAAFQILREEFPGTSVGVIGESIGSGPASSLASAKRPPDKIVLVVPFDTFESVASEHMPFLPIGLMLRDNWNNINALSGFAGSIDIYGAIDDRIIPFEHAKHLASALPGARFVTIGGGHNDWSNSELVHIGR